MTELAKEQQHILNLINSTPLCASPYHDNFWAQLVDLCRNGARGNHPSDAESLYATGAKNLQQVRQFWQSAFDALGVQWANWHEYLTNFQLTAEEIVITAAQAQDCNIISHWTTSVVDGLIPQCPIETVPLQERSTTFHNCGWCAHAIANTTEFHTDAATKGYCRLLGADLMQFTSCKETCYLTKTTGFDPELLKERLRHTKELLEQELRKTEQLQEDIRLRLDILDEAIKKAPQGRPLYSCWRNPNYFCQPREDLCQNPTSENPSAPELSPRGREVVCFLEVAKNTFTTVHGFVIDIVTDERTHKTTVYVYCEIRPGYYADDAIAFDLASCDIFDRAGFNYLREHQKDFPKWLAENRSQDCNLDPNRVKGLAQALFYSGNT